jgi:hypothetical protein
MIYHPRPVQWAFYHPQMVTSEFHMRTGGMTMRAAEAHIIARSQHEGHVMINYVSCVTASNSDGGLFRDSAFLQTKREPNQITCRIKERVQLQS